jgi:hypothetical protein
MEHSSWRADSCWDRQHISILSVIRAVIIVFRLTLNSVCSQVSPLHTQVTCLFKVHFTIIFASTPMSRGFFRSVFPTTVLQAFLIFPMCATCPVHLSLLDLITVRWNINYEASFLVIFSSSVQIFASTLFSNALHIQACLYRTVWNNSEMWSINSWK